MIRTDAVVVARGGVGYTLPIGYPKPKIPYPWIPYLLDTLPIDPKKDMGTWKESGTRDTLPWKGERTRNLEGT